VQTLAAPEHPAASPRLRLRSARLPAALPDAMEGMEATARAERRSWRP
jgi:hypothetical protein